MFDNGANVSIGIHEDDFIKLKKKPGSITGVGSAKAEGIGTIHWKLRTDSGKYIDVLMRDALYVPSMDLRIISVAQWGKQRTQDRKDGLSDNTKIVTQPDYDRSTVFIDRRKERITIEHTNDLPLSIAANILTKQSVSLITSTNLILTATTQSTDVGTKLTECALLKSTNRRCVKWIPLIQNI